jgi:hypothetical protein
MAKIYETKEDLQRDQLKDEAARLKLKASEQNYWSLAALGTGAITSMWPVVKESTRRTLSVVSIAFSVVGLVEWVRSWGTSSKASTVEMQSRLTGSGVVKMPADAVVPEQECHHCHMQDARPKSLLEYAAKNTGPDVNIKN